MDEMLETWNPPPSMFQYMLTTKASIIKSQIGINQEQTVNALRKYLLLPLIT